MVFYRHLFLPDPFHDDLPTFQRYYNLPSFHHFGLLVSVLLFVVACRFGLLMHCEFVTDVFWLLRAAPVLTGPVASCGNIIHTVFKSGLYMTTPVLSPQDLSMYGIMVASSMGFWVTGNLILPLSSP
uniref:Uncharacterized protein n=1 Tax=Moniliophthora roreri TaxID=221103 RepID=A0A0W0G1C7_MONRR